MKNILLSIAIFLFISNIYSQEAIYIKGKCYKGYIFSKEHSLLGNPPEENRYTPSLVDVAMAEKILINYLKSNQKEHIKFPIDKRTYKKYTRQYIGYLTRDNEIVIRINLFDRRKLEECQFPALDIIPLLGYCCIQINIATKELSNWEEIR